MKKVYIYLLSQNITSTYFNANDIGILFEQIGKDITDFIRKTKSSNPVKNEIHTDFTSLNTGFINRPSPSLSVFNSKYHQVTPIHPLTKESLHFLCFLTMTDILRRISSYTSNELSEMWTTLRSIYTENNVQLDYIDELKDAYRACETIKYYTNNSGLSRSVNQVCHTENMQRIFAFRVYISDLHKQLVECHQQEKRDDLKSFIQMVYRGKPLSGSVLQQLIDNEGGLITMNGFLSTTIMNKVASFYHGDNQVSKVNEGYKPVLFVFEITTDIKQPYAYISTCSTKPDEAEVLFSLGTIWRIKFVKLDHDLCTITLASCDELDPAIKCTLEKVYKKRV